MRGTTQISEVWGGDALFGGGGNTVPPAQARSLIDNTVPQPKPVEFQWVGAPGYVNPIFIRCYADRIEYYDLFRNRERVVRLGRLMLQINRKNPELLRYFSEIAAENLRIKRRFGQTEHYPLLLVYPDGILAAEVLMALIEQVEGLNVGLEPMLPHWEVPYQSQVR